jgi:hypothetical protein
LRETQKDQFIRPVAAFITFENQEAYERACNLKGVRNWKNELVQASASLLNEPFAMWEAPEPTNIIWENRDKTVQEQLKRKIIVVLLIIVLLLAAFTAFYVLKRQAIDNYLKYPPTTDCKSIIDMFGGDFNDPKFQDLAKRDKDNTLSFKGTGIYQCFCSKYPGKDSDVSFCDNYNKDQLVGMGLSKIVSFSIVIVNFVLRTVNMILIKYIGHHTESQQTTAIMTSIFVSSLLNTAILLLLANANTQ